MNLNRARAAVVAVALLVVPIAAEGQSTVVLHAAADSVLRYAHPDQNDGAAELLLMKTGGGVVRSLVGFDVPALGAEAVLARATLVLTIAQIENTWGAGRHVSVNRVQEDWVEGNGRLDHVKSLFPGLKYTSGSGQGVTWNCAIDQQLGGSIPHCATKWAGGTFDPTPTDAVLHVNGMAGTVAWDVTDDVADLIGAGGSVSWIVKKASESVKGGKVYYFSREGAAHRKKPEIGPRLILELE
jgi:hypothetical protein